MQTLAGTADGGTVAKVHRKTRAQGDSHRLISSHLHAQFETLTDELEASKGAKRNADTALAQVRLCNGIAPHWTLLLPGECASLSDHRQAKGALTTAEADKKAAVEAVDATDKRIGEIIEEMKAFRPQAENPAKRQRTTPQSGRR